MGGNVPCSGEMAWNVTVQNNRNERSRRRNGTI